ncbi:hypothetical protein B9Q03_10435 [Candidatus Marsarchaeota G2 archaeon OSP_D]|jgi:hypothetical protein|uniref:Uncharacterized protein n=5 Tax=Candidatus Marsarchaeota group 2 TaxID=2203771 RepID=A0A2R6C816_9ARCH|nr:MAG: hypothetical protein B9Q03_10435 [Candidatus Marsarchaeota G2 archaeon OSP_D]PSN95566.1 MAG: hypothetical protein B9Q06_05135 [Candidatus Marsarchaeota G2 archaeon ECH_B_2]PSO00086.1 MAG: hypothetical protein B9Q07_05065 [Candidatus Marsarchaeota G2 archaeon ECH_B_3]PSO02200.1 MAG: hypothetical protein B9Q05_05775 [Candidatus Marsarchaeota G2 archaeon ECH_B_1]PSO07021.1 MAG: hypothetical protein B9Q04_13070 [Candidatus Marsarchaeota G2 archaeon BE_D]
MGLVYNAGRGLIIAGIITLFEAALVYSKYLPGDANLLGEYSYLFLLAGVIVIAISTKLDFLDYEKKIEGGRTREKGEEMSEENADKQA